MSDIFDRLHEVTGISKYSNSEVVTPIHIVKDMIDLLPVDVFNPEATFLDPAVKSGRFLVEIYNRLMNSLKMIETFPDSNERKQHILKKQLYGVATSAVTATFVRKQLYDNPKKIGNIIYDSNVTSKLIQGAFDNMKFDVVIGNPPYNRGGDIDFVNLGFELSTKYCVMITPAKWQTAEANQKIASKMSYGEFRKKLVPHMSHIVLYPDASDIFSIEQVDGVCFFCIDKSEHDECTVINKSRLQKHFNSRSTRDIRNRQTLHNIGNDIIGSIGAYKVYTFNKSKPKRFQVWTNSQMGGIGGRGGFNKEGEYTYLLGNEGSAQFLSISRIIDSSDAVDMSTRTGASTLSFSSDDRQECENFVSWINTRFTRWFVAINISKLTGVINDDTFRLVPIPSPDTQGHTYGHPDFKFDHIYTDEELYKYYGLDKKYIDVIESVIKERK